MTLFEMSFDQEFEAFWKSGSWRKLGKLKAHLWFRRTVTSPQDWADIQAARDNYRQYVQENPWYTPKRGEFWFKASHGIPYWRQFVETEEKHGQYARFVK